MTTQSWTDDLGALTKNFTFHNFKEAMVFAQKVGELAEKANHHPDIIIHGYKYVQIILTTHDEGKVTEKDHELAKEIDTL